MWRFVIRFPERHLLLGLPSSLRALTGEGKENANTAAAVASALRLDQSLRPAAETASAGALKRSSNCAATACDRIWRSISKKRFRLQASRLHVPASSSSRSRTNAFFVQHGQILEDAHARIEERRVGGAAVRPRKPGSCSPFAGTKRRTWTPRRAGLFDPPDHPWSGHVRVDHVERLARAVPNTRTIASVIGRKRPGALWRTRAGIGSAPASRGGKRSVERGGRQVAAEPAEARDEHELELSDDGAGHPQEEVVEAAVVEVVLDPGAADPARLPVHDEELAVVDVAERLHVPVRRAAAAELPGGRAGLRGAHDADVDAPAIEPVVVRLQRPARDPSLAGRRRPSPRHRPRPSRSARRRTRRPRPPAGSRTG